jgi:hypothetical protein
MRAVISPLLLIRLAAQPPGEPPVMREARWHALTITAIAALVRMREKLPFRTPGKKDKPLR